MDNFVLPKNWCVERTPENYKEINRHFSLLYGKKYFGKGKSDLYRSDYMHFPKVVTRRYKIGRTSLTYARHEPISFEAFKKYVMKQPQEDSNKPFKLPEKWYINGGKEFAEYLKETGYILLKGDISCRGYWYDKNYWTHIKIENMYEGRQQITVEQYKRSMLNDNTKKHVGWKLKDSNFKEAARHIYENKARENERVMDRNWFQNNFDNNLETNGWNFALALNEFGTENIFKQVGVLDLWFEPVYETEPQLPEILGDVLTIPYKGCIKGDNVRYGCALLPIAWFTESENRQIVSFTTSNGIIISKENVDAIRKYLKYHGHVK
jgi:hypothetical protein